MSTRYACLALLLAPVVCLAEPGERVRDLHPNETLYSALHGHRGELRPVADLHRGAFSTPAHDESHVGNTAPLQRIGSPPVQTREPSEPVAAPEVSPAHALMAVTFFGFALAVARGRRRRYSVLKP